MKILVINGHPRPGSFSEAIFTRFIAGANQVAEVKSITLYEEEFERDVIERSPKLQVMETSLEKARNLITWCHHIVFIFPTWWGTMPGILKSFLDRVLTEGFAFNEIEGGTGYEPLLKGRSAMVITTMDTPSFVYRIIYGAPGLRMMRHATLGFCGISPTKFKKFGPVRGSSQLQREKWLEETYQMGLNCRNAVSLHSRFSKKVVAWLKAIRLQFYPMTWIAYACGAFAAERFGYGYDRTVFWMGYLWLFLLEISTVLSNEYFDYKTDRQNKYFGPFNGGSRVIVEGDLSKNNVRNGAIISFMLSIPVLIFLLYHTTGSTSAILATAISLVILAIGYTVPPLKLSYRTLGEVTVGITHSVAVIISGYIFQGGSIMDSFPWLVSIPLFLSVLPSIILAGIPDQEADRSAGKRTIAVRIGIRNAASLALALTILAAVTGTFLSIYYLEGTYGYLFYLIIPHSILLSWMLYRYIQTPSQGRIDKLMVAALTYLVWFGVTAL